MFFFYLQLDIRDKGYARTI